MKKLFPIFCLAYILMLWGCEKDQESIDVSLLDSYYYSALYYRDYPNDLTLDTFNYYFNSDSVIITGFRYERINNVQTPTEKDTVTHAYYIDGEKIVFPPTELPYNELHTPIKFLGALVYDSAIWEIIRLDRTQLILERYNNNKEIISHQELTAQPR